MPKRSDDIVWHGPGGEKDSHREFVRAVGCLLARSGCAYTVEVHHVKSRAAGGTYRDLVPLCLYHHRSVHDMGRDTFAARHDIDLAAEAAHLFERHYRERGVCSNWDGDHPECTGHQCECGEGLCAACLGCEEDTE